MKSAFQYCDKNGDNMLNSEDIRSMLADHGFFATERELNSIMRKYDKDMDSKISYAEFIEELSPKIGGVWSCE